MALCQLYAYRNHNGENMTFGAYILLFLSSLVYYPLSITKIMHPYVVVFFGIV